MQQIKGIKLLKIGIIILLVILLLIPTSLGSLMSTPNNNLFLRAEYIVPPYVQIGDLIFVEILEFDLNYSLWGWDHIGIYIGNNQFIDAAHKGVGITTLSEFMSWNVEIAYGTVIATEEQRNEAIEFIVGQIGKPYQNFTFHFSLEDLLNLDIIAMLCNRTKDAGYDTEAWYCSELIWAAYLSCTSPIEIDQNGDGIDRPNWVWPSEISSDNDVEMYTYHELNEWDLDLFLDWLRDLFLNIIND